MNAPVGYLVHLIAEKKLDDIALLGQLVSLFVGPPPEAVVESPAYKRFIVKASGTAFCWLFWTESAGFADGFCWPYKLATHRQIKATILMETNAFLDAGKTRVAALSSAYQHRTTVNVQYLSGDKSGMSGA